MIDVVVIIWAVVICVIIPLAELIFQFLLVVSVMLLDLVLIGYCSGCCYCSSCCCSSCCSCCGYCFCVPVVTIVAVLGIARLSVLVVISVPVVRGGGGGGGGGGGSRGGVQFQTFSLSFALCPSSYVVSSCSYRS